MLTIDLKATEHKSALDAKASLAMARAGRNVEADA
jgi:hypothetical protein